MSQPFHEPEIHENIPDNPIYRQPLTPNQHGPTERERDASKRKITAAYSSIFMLVLVIAVISIPFLFFSMFSITSALFLTIVAELVTVALGLLIIQAGKNWKSALRLHNFRWKSTLIGAGIGTGLFLTLQALALGVNAIAPEGGGIESSETSLLLGSATGIELYLILLVIVPIIVPFVEELFFRGYIFGFLKDSRAPLWSAFLVSSIYFAILHAQGFSSFGDFFIIAWTGVIALVHAFLVHKYDSIWPAVFSHIFYNLITSVIVLFQMV